MTAYGSRLSFMLPEVFVRTNDTDKNIYLLDLCRKLITFFIDGVKDYKLVE